MLETGPHGRRIAQERALALIRSVPIEAARRTLRDNGITFSSEVSTAVDLNAGHESPAR